MKDNQAKYPQLRFKGFTDPWEERKLGEVSKYSNGGSYENDVVENGTYELITLKSVNMSGKLVSSGKFINRETKTLEKDTLVMILSEQAPGLLGMTAKIPENNRYVLNQRVAEIKPNTNIDSYFLSMSINRSQAYFSKRGAGTKVQNISKPNVENFEFYCPSEREQQKIGSFFKHLDDTIALHQRKLTKLKELKQGYLQKMFPKNGSKFPQLRFAGFADAWEQRKVSELADRYDNLRVPITASERVAGETPYYGANGIQDYVEGFTHNGEFVLVAEDGANDLQNYPVQYVDGKVWVNNHVHVLQAKEERVDNKFLTNALKHTNIEPYLVGGGRAKLNADVMMKINFKVPTLPEQVQIGKFFDNLDHLITLHQRKLEKLQELKKGYLQKMFC